MEARKQILLEICEILARQENFRVSRNLAETSSVTANACALSVLPGTAAGQVVAQTMKSKVTSVADIIRGELTEKKKMKLVIAVDSFFWSYYLPMQKVLWLCSIRLAH